MRRWSRAAGRAVDSPRQRGVIGHGGGERPGCGGRGRGEHGGAVVPPRKVVPYPSPMSPNAQWHRQWSTESRWRAQMKQEHSKSREFEFEPVLLACTLTLIRTSRLDVLCTVRSSPCEAGSGKDRPPGGLEQGDLSRVHCTSELGTKFREQENSANPARV